MASPTITESFGSFRGLASELLAEWWRELGNMVRDVLASPLARGTEYVLLQVEPEEVRAVLVSGGREQEIGRATGEGNLRAREISSLLAASEITPRGTKDVALELPESEVLRRQFELPAASRATLANAVPFELERLSPIEADRLYYDFSIVETSKAKKLARLELRIVKRQTVDPAIEMARAAGLQVGAIRFAGDPREADWRSFPLDRKALLHLKWRRWNVVILALLAIFLATAVVFAAYWRGAAAADELSSEVEAAGTRAAVVHRLSHDIADVQAQIEFPLQQKRAPFLLALLKEVTRLLPDGTWLTEFELDGGKVHIQGYAKSASDVVGEIDRSPLFANAQFMAPLQSAQNGNERFDLSFDVKVPHDAKAPHDVKAAHH
ncbi:MAG TPA: PilN domain-containing protein [Rhizomicrobium sp.]|jgi:general secretion pathway protein L|nr:PilN domain-containing protein [Rhizomicrobium sp.]